MNQPVPGGIAKIDRRRSIEKEIDRWQSIEGEKEKKKEEEEEEKKKEEYLLSPHRPHPRAVATRGSPAGDSSPARGDGMSPHAGRKIEATRKKKKRKRRKKKRRRRKKNLLCCPRAVAALTRGRFFSRRGETFVVLARAPSPSVGRPRIAVAALSRGRFFSRARRKIEVTYLHEVCFPSVVHKNIKSSNILLDAELNPHLADCVITLLHQDTSETLGPGYNPPECTKPSAYTTKSDIYSFGVVMLELLTGRKPFDSSKPRIEQSLVRWAAPQLHDIDALAGMVDPALRGLYPPKSLSRFADVIALCIQVKCSLNLFEPEFRPAMSEVVQSLARCVRRTSINKRLGGDLSTSRRSDDSDYGYY
ncbi:hypothetical protein BHM03_00052385 [Ensete ventricosum]|nr:hypothetical protein BHM03_00052385 [Ensete ventricosum]